MLPQKRQVSEKSNQKIMRFFNKNKLEFFLIILYILLGIMAVYIYIM